MNKIFRESETVICPCCAKPKGRFVGRKRVKRGYVPSFRCESCHQTWTKQIFTDFSTSLTDWLMYWMGSQCSITLSRSMGGTKKNEKDIDFLIKKETMEI